MTQGSCFFLAVGMPRAKFSRTTLPIICGTDAWECIGASIDFLTEKQRRAPVWVQQAGLEWLYRLLSDPQRLARRYLIERPRIFYFICLE
jgi:exopolysaccharide biosynthesis WecB/TagA/CpsF family protein